MDKQICRWLIGASRQNGTCHREGKIEQLCSDLEEKFHMRLLCTEHAQELEMIWANANIKKIPVTSKENP